MLDLVEQLFGSRDVYAVLEIDSKHAAHPKNLRSSYLKAALAYHPDKADSKDKEVSTQKFQVLTKIYEVLKDDDNRKEFEDTGVWPGDDSMDVDASLFSRLDEDTILDFKKYYQGSDEETSDVKALYEKHHGNFIKVLEGLFFATFVEEEFERVENIVETLVSEGKLVEIPPANLKAFQAEKKRKINKAKKEAAEAEALLEAIRSKKRGTTTKLDPAADLVGAILARRESASTSFLDNLEAKYSALEKEKAVPKPPRRKKQRKE